jgi:pimeloyl-ACP methyl ester carboxylesterase
VIAALWLLVPVVLVLAAATCLSFSYTRRQPRTVFHKPAEYGLEGEEMTFQASDGLELRGCWIPAARCPAPAVIILHGHGGSLDTDLHRAPAFHEAGFDVFLFDFRAHGESRGRVASFGYLERRDVQGAVTYVRGRGSLRMGLLGFSYGGIASMVAAPLCPDVGAVASDGGPARMRSAIAGRGVEWRFPRWFSRWFAWLIISVTSLRLGANLFRYDAVRWVGRIAPRPILFVHGEDDPYLDDFDDLWESAAEPKEAWRLPGVGHTKASELYLEEFDRRVIAFFRKHLDIAATPPRPA